MNGENYKVYFAIDLKLTVDKPKEIWYTVTIYNHHQFRKDLYTLCHPKE